MRKTHYRVVLDVFVISDEKDDVEMMLYDCFNQVSNEADGVEDVAVISVEATDSR